MLQYTVCMDEKKLEEMYDMVRENNSMLKSARRSAFIGGLVKTAWWVLILFVLPYVTWLYIAPYLNTVVAQYDALQKRGGQVQAQAADVQKQLNDLRGVSSGFMDFLKSIGINGQ